MRNEKLASNPIGVVLQFVGAKWKILIINELLKTELRFAELKKRIGCTSKVLTKCLKEMEEDELVVREEDQRHPNRVEYYLTDIGYTLQPVVTSMQKWGKEYKKYIKLKNKVQK